MLEALMNVKTFIARWADSGGAARANYVSFLTDLCRLLSVTEPEPARPNDADNAYVFEKAVADPHEDGKATPRRIDLYRRGCFVLEAKQGVEQEAEEEAEVRAAGKAAGKQAGKKARGQNEVTAHAALRAGTPSCSGRVGEIVEMFIELG